MKNKTNSFLCLIAVSTSFFNCTRSETTADFDLTVAGLICFADGIGRQTIGIIDCLKNDLKINFLNTRNNQMNLQDIAEDTQKIITNQQHGYSNVVILEDVLTNGNPIEELRENYYTLLPESTIKFAYTMFEATTIPDSWPIILNNHFDAAIVPDENLVDVYKNAGVIIPIFVLPLGIYIEDFLAKPQKKSLPNNPFVFGFSGSFAERKNQMVLLESFIYAFGNRADIQLKIHGRSGSEIAQQLKYRVQQLAITNVEIIEECFSWKKYVAFMESIDCYVSLSKGEGFSITPREALALGIPCILSNNTAHKTICNTDLVYAVDCPIVQPAFYSHLNQSIGFDFNCTINDAAQAFIDVYENYKIYLEKAARGKKWVKRYLYNKLRPYYLSLIKPKKVIFGTENYITKDCLITSCRELYQKYKRFLPLKKGIA
ncbi:MAG: glycosyltransferase [Candidatus Babeliales bacterium]